MNSRRGVAIVCFITLLLGVGFLMFNRYTLKDRVFSRARTVQRVPNYHTSSRWRPNDTYTATHVTKDCNPKVANPRFYSQSMEDKALLEKYFSTPQICNGVYVEIGALNGVTYSNTKFFEDNLKWTGVLIEAEPNNARQLKRNRPHSIVIPEAVCPEGQTVVKFIGRSAIGGIPDQMPDSHKKHFIDSQKKKFKEITVLCRPIGRMLREAGVEAIDFFILDVEGAELMVLQTMDWTIPVKAFVVEMGRGDRDKTLISLLAEKGYYKASWNIRDFCIKGQDCTNNAVFENSNFQYTFNT